ncbi:kinetochore-associated Ndc80 complex subunit spc25 [Lunasporangiospora selenospora]|uniref:Kinetochore protein SPC25 n=1 Tax=Lunasporangiospora selenospora TaxID=979761 RepID=A0A9P6KEY4_9FUNG|nr:kinetochore-associated Ndc80 complex subunit spc25 [Lunasporangiospora selenospora]
MATSESSMAPSRGSFGRTSDAGFRSSLRDSTSSAQRLSLASNRLSLLPSKSGVAGTTTAAPVSMLPVPQFDSDELSARVLTFTNDLNIGIQRIKSKISENTELWVQETSEIHESDREAQEALRVARAQESVLAKTLKKEKEEASNMTKSVQSLSDRQEEMKQAKQALETQVATLRREVIAKREAKIAQKKALDEQVLKNKPELATYEAILALRIDHIGFVFTRIDEQDWDREFSITVDVSRQEFLVSDCTPTLPELPSLLRQLNETRDFYGFLKHARQGFKELARK